MRKQAGIIIKCHVTCEACDHKYDTQKLIKESGGGMSDVSGKVQARLLFTKQLIVARTKNPRCEVKLLWDILDTASQSLVGFTDDSSIPKSKCPECGYLQSWQQYAWQNSRERLWGNLVAGIWMIPVLIVLFRWVLVSLEPHWLKLVIRLGIALLAYMALFFLGTQLFSIWTIPNRKWHRDHGDQMPTPREPVVTTETPSYADVDCPFL